MDYKKKYEDAVKKLEKFFINGDDRILYKHDIEKVFPELKESEDEKIRKEIIKSIENNMCVIHKDKCIAWLEKQGEREHVVIPKFRVGDVIRPKGSMEEYTIESISGECYHGKGWGLHIGYDDDYELVEQKPAWSEEDENGLEDALWAIQQARTIAKDENDMGNLWYAETWLKSLKERMKGE